MKNILVVGGAGYIGSHMVKMLGEEGFNVSVIDNLSSGYQESILFGDLIEGNMEDSNLVCSVLRKKKIDLVMHFASNIEVGESIMNPKKYYQNNVANTLSLINSMLECNIKNFIFSSTAAIFGNPNAKKINEDYLTNPINPYGKSKLMIEQILDDYDAAYSFKSICFRYFNAAGSDPDGHIGELHDPETHLIPLLIKAFLKEKEFFIFGDDYPTYDGTCIRDFIHVNDICDAHLRGIKYLSNEKKSAKFNLGNGEGYSIKDVISSFKNITDKELNITIKDRRAGDPPILVADSTKARKILGWSPKMGSLETIITDALNFYESRH
jgi:UDP-glucose 4-epimerase